MRPLMLGIVGDSAAGKTTLTSGVVRILGRNGVTPICLDDYRRYGRAERIERGLAAVDPAANDLALMAEHLGVLRAGGTIRKPVYDHQTGTLREPELVVATGLVVAYGMLTLTPPEQLAPLFDLTVYLEPDEALRHRWRLARDTGERGYTAEQVQALQLLNDRAAVRHVHVQRRHAALVVHFRAAPDPQEDGSVSLAVDLLLRHNARGGPLDSFLALVADNRLPGLRLSRNLRDADNCQSDLLQLDAHLDPDTVALLQTELWRELAGIPPLPTAQLGTIGGRGQPARSDTLALVQLLLVALLVRGQS